MDTTGRTVIASTVFVDLIGFSLWPVAEQLDTKKLLNKAIRDAINHVVEDERLVLDTGDGAALCFLGDPEDALFAAASIGKVFSASRPQLRVGVNLGPVKVVTDINGRPNVVGDGINVAQRVMDFAVEGEILVSRSFFEVVARLRDGNERLFHFIGSKRDKHVREHQVYSFSMHEHLVTLENPEKALSEQSGAPGSMGARSSLPAKELETAKVRLAERIGPIAGILVRRAAVSADSLQSLYKAISVAIPDEADRATFLASAGLAASAAGDDTSVAKPSTAAFDTAMLETLERDLARHIGPLARILIKKSARQSVDLADLYERLAKNIQDEDERREFLAAAPYRVQD